MTSKTTQEEKESILQERKRILEIVDDLWENNCLGCQKIEKAMEEGILKKASDWKSRSNEICNACDFDTEIKKIGIKLDDLLKADRQLRKRGD